MASVLPNNPFDLSQSKYTPSVDTVGVNMGAGLIGQAAQYTPQTSEVDRPTQTSAGQVESLLAGDSPLMQRARTLAQQQMAGRGLVNSSMAIEAGTGAMIDRVTPLALQDAQIYAQRAETNMNALNRAGEFNVGEQNKFGLQGSQQAFTAGENALNRQFTTSERLGGQQFTSGENALQRQFTTGERLGSQDFTSGENREQRQFTTSERLGGQTFQMSMQDAQQGFTAAQNNLTRAQERFLAERNIEAQQALQVAQQQFTAAQNDLTRTQERVLATQRMTWESGENSLNRQVQLQVQQLQEAGADRRQAQSLATQWAITQLQEAGVTNRFDQEIALKSSQFNAEQINADRRLVQSHQMELERLGYAANLNRETVPTQYAADVARNSQTQINSILADPNLTPAAKTEAVNNVINAGNAQLDWAESFYGTSIPNLSAPSTSGTAGGTSTASSASAAPPPPPAPPAPANDPTPYWSYQQHETG